MEQRANTVITTSGVLVTLLFGLGSLVTKAESYVLPDVTKAPLIAALLLFAIAAFAALWINMPLGYEFLNAQSLRERLLDENSWSEGKILGEKELAQQQVTILETVRKMNTRKAYALTVSLACEALAVTAISISLIVVLTSA